MKLISLNLWGGRVYGPLEKFLKEHVDNVDIFCFQEIYNDAVDGMSDVPREHRRNLLADLRQLLPNHKAYFRPVIKNVYGIGIFVKKDISVLEEGEMDIYKSPDYTGHGGNHTRNLQWIKIEVDGEIYSIVNVHGLWTGKGKNDTPERIAQSQKIKKFMSVMSNPKILCGDFNLLPDTESMKMLECDMINLIKKHGIKSTRSHHYAKEEKFADYVLVSSDVKVKKFKVLQEPVSDHLPLLLEFA
ncbi:MAG TPA: endonuclease/exonuclease/phosphatase family protein [Candidatus Nanoarchaeia archaeon]|nr:endonuclease/exonuclease/phosphatase family protein [Candidatus Nanoarchaeia archaeon]